jgi:hypothetical protein
MSYGYGYRDASEPTPTTSEGSGETMSNKRLSHLEVNDTGKLTKPTDLAKAGDEFIVVEKVAEDRSSGSTTIEYRNGARERIFTGSEYPDNQLVEPTGKSERKTTW